jgi:hypothetical protein
LAFGFSSTYLVVVTLVQTSFYSKIKQTILESIGGLFLKFGFDLTYFDIGVISLVLLLTFTFWRRGDEAAFGRLFTVNMLLYFPAVLDYSAFNWVDLILPYGPSTPFSDIWVFLVGLLLQTTYLTLRSTVRIRGERDELINRGGEISDVNAVSKGQVTYLLIVLGGVLSASFLLFKAVPLTSRYLMAQAVKLPYSHILIGVSCIILISASIALYLRGGEKTEKEFEMIRGEPEGESQI